ncbi:MAG: hypothetical protein KKE02_20995 [Alphaproteobacteria bacterium]|nr:hypothetical protein [Alphaproteobacteria bacterium]MBU1514487.1 hypothetical protein [Alphaproteobacteria bacterium]MBU2096881.1 hypothetical protein [Alphaproteobacteria bacterium]MBU2153508.1 hypothetical protein [Alphaproteobacteria bacterium]MBU2305987.1 hypothetical protein [Alphaproteobacteria bacterium]
MAVTAQADDRPRAAEAHRVIAPAFDPDFYRATYADLPADMGPLWHYRMAGWQEGRDPAPWFSVERYLTAHPDVAKAGVEPFSHFLGHGRHEGRDIFPSRHAAAYFGQIGWTPDPWSHESFAASQAPATVGGRRRRVSAPPLTPEEHAAVAAEFDTAFYLALNPDVATAGMDPLEHFIRTGWLEERDPNARFSVLDYLENNPDVAAANINPFAHYLTAGRAEGRSPRHALGFRYDVIARLKPVEARIAEAAAASARLRADPPGRLAAALGKIGDLHITLSHDNYVEHSGGLQFCVRREAEQFGRRGVAHLHLYPAVPWPAVRAADEAGPLGVLLNGRRLGFFTPEAVRDALRATAAGPGRRSFAIHSLLGHGADAAADILAAAGLSDGFFWVHDFASLCVGFHLLRNDVEDCAAPPADSAACRVCAYGPSRVRHTQAHRRLFERLNITVVAPSQTTLDFWRAHGDLPAHDAVVLPHARLEPRKTARKPSADRPFRLAYLGMPTPLKGWPVFRDLAQRFEGDPRYEFLHLGGAPDPTAPAAFHRVVVTAEQPRAMQDTLEALHADAALIWPLCRETFSFTAYEAAAAGAAVLTGPDSGNVAAFAADPGIGRVLADEAALAAAFASGEILTLGRGPRKAMLYDLAYSGMTGDLVA